MSHYVFRVEFNDGFRLFGVTDTTGCYTYRFLFSTQEAAHDWISSGYDENGRHTRERPDFHKPADIEMTEEAVIFDPGQSWSFVTRASRKALWLTGPRNSDEILAEQVFDDTLPYGGGL